MRPLLSPHARRNIRRVVPYGVIWLLLAQVFLISDYAAVGDSGITPDGAIALSVEIYLFASLAVAAVGCLIGVVEVLYLNRRLAAYSLGTKLVAKTLFYIAFLMGVILITYPIAAALEMDTGLTDGRVWERLQGFLISKASLSTAVQMTTSLVASLFYAEISEHMGAHVLTNFLTGRYHTPKEERRVFLFSDMKSSTAITERLGHARYFAFLRAYYDALGDAVIHTGGEVYQYIGDEIVVSWPEETALRDGNCIRCVLRMTRDLHAREAWFREHFGVAPGFRAGLQVGAVTTGEIGALKKEIVFTGDVLNQTARIQALCKGLGTDVLVGDALASRLPASGAWSLRSVGQHELRGKAEPVELFALDASGPSASGARGR